MKRFIWMISIVALCILLIGCDTGNTPVKENNVRLCDYENITIGKSVYTVTSEELKTALDMRLSMADGEKGLQSEITDALKMEVLTEIVSHRICEYVYAYIINNSFIREDAAGDAYVNGIIEMHRTAADKEGIPFDIYLKEYHETDEVSMRQSLYDFYVEMQIIIALTKKESGAVTDAQREELIRAIADEEKVTPAEVESSYDGMYIDYLIAGEMAEEIIAEKYKEEIRNAADAVYADIG